MKPKILIILGSTREGRRGIKIANLVMQTLSLEKDADFEFVDLKDWNLPFFNFPVSPSMQKDLYQSKLQEKWAKKIGSGDGFIFIIPEYNHSFPAVLKNALDFIWFEWNKKPVSFISYGGLSGGVRAIEQLRLVTIELEMIPIIDCISIPKIKSLISENGVLKIDGFDKRVKKLGSSITIWSKELAKIRKDLP